MEECKTEQNAYSSSIFTNNQKVHSIVGGVNILTLHGNHPANTSITCDPEFYDYYFHAKIVQLPVYAVYAVYYFVFLFFVVPMESRSYFHILLYVVR